MNEVLFKTKPRLITFGGLFSGFLFFLVMALFTIKVSYNGEHSIVGYSIASIFILFSISSIYHLFKTQTIKILKGGIVVEKYLLFNKRFFIFEEVNSIKQSEEKITIYPGINIFEKGFLFSNYNTVISLKSSEKIILTSVTVWDFIEVEKLFFKLKRGEGKVKRVRKDSVCFYIYRNILSIILLLIVNILSLALLIQIIT